MPRKTRSELDTRREEVLAGINLHIDDKTRAGMKTCFARFRRQVKPGDVVLALYGGGKDSSFIVALARYFQLRLLKAEGWTFTLRVASNFQAGMTRGVVENIDRAYRALGLYDDPLVELIAVAGDEAEPFTPRYTIPSKVIAFNRLGILMNGHRTAGSNRATFCNACNFSMLKSFALGITCGGREASLVITGDSRTEQKRYAVAIARMAKQRGVPPAAAGPDFRGFLATSSALAIDYNTQLFGPDDGEARRYEMPLVRITGEPAFFTPFEDVDYALGSHWELITQFMGFRFDTIAFSFTESDCANPALMCHLRGLKSERVWGRTYAEGVAEYVGFATDMMRRKKFPDALVRTMEERYAGDDGAARTRAEATAYAAGVLGLTDDQLACLLFAPFTQEAKNLTAYLTAERPAFLPRRDAIREVLAGASDDPEVVAAVEDWSGLDVARLRVLFAANRIDNATPAAQPVEPIGIMFRNDPHQAEIQTRHSPDGPSVIEIESGR